MNLGEMKDWIVRDTKRPDKRDEQVQDSINAAIEWATTQGDYSSDLVEGSVAISSSLYASSISISANFTRFRKVKYLKPASYRRYLTWKDPSRLLTDGQLAVDCWYRAGNNLEYNLSVLQTTMLYGYYQYPAFLTDDTDEHWMLDQMPSCIHDLAMWRVFEQIGNESEASRFATIGNRYLSAHKADLQDGVSHS